MDTLITENAIAEISPKHLGTNWDNPMTPYNEQFGELKAFLVKANISKPTWYRIVQAASILMTDTSGGRVYTALDFAKPYEDLDEQGFNDCYEVAMVYFDVLSIKTYYVYPLHFDVQDLFMVAYKKRENPFFSFMAEKLLLLDLRILQYYEKTSLNACFLTIEKGIGMCKEADNQDGIKAISNYAVKMLSPGGLTFLKCQKIAQKFR